MDKFLFNSSKSNPNFKYEERYQDLFNLDESYALAHCISADFAMGKGIVVKFNEYFNLKNTLRSKYQNYENTWISNGKRGTCIKEGKVFNLITKEKYYQKPTMQSMSEALISMREQAIQNNITKIAMPKIGCGLDKLIWENVSSLIKNIFNQTNIEILVCYV